MPAVSFHLESLSSPIGEVLIVTDDADRLRAVDFTDYADRMRQLLRLHYGDRVELTGRRAASTAHTALAAYFAGDLTAIDALVTETAGTAFQRAIWRALREIPVGQTLTYAALAARIGKPAAVRATGAANGANPVSIVAPCHRLIGANGALTGYGGGLERKRWLLRHEGVAVKD
jgi:methylated-DNA-[protein]-cysteine S-methyltransferase